MIVRQRKPWRRKEGTYIYFEDNAGVIVNPKGEMKGEWVHCCCASLGTHKHPTQQQGLLLREAQAKLQRSRQQPPGHRRRQECTSPTAAAGAAAATAQQQQFIEQHATGSRIAFGKTAGAAGELV